MATKIPRPPSGLNARGCALWRSVLKRFELDVHELELLHEAARILDVCDELAGLVAAEGAVITSPQGRKAHPAVVELRQQQLGYARLVAAMRIPLGEADAPGQLRGQLRAVRGVYGTGGAS